MPGAIHSRRLIPCGPPCSGLTMVLTLALALPLPLHAAEPAASPAATDKEPPLADLTTILPDLRKGGYVIYFRHGPTDQSVADDTEPDFSRCDSQRNLTAAGREQASQIGQAFRALHIPVGEVISSPFCRTKDTAQLAFARYTVNRDLYFALNVDAAERDRLSKALRRMLATQPGRANTIIVAHSANLKEAAGIWPKPEGVAYDFRPQGGGRFVPLARVLPDDWIRLDGGGNSPVPRSPGGLP